jgi:hypothetical protein
MRRILPAIALIALLASCTQAPPPEVAVEETPEPTVQSALEKTRAQGSAAMGILILTTLGEEEAAVDGEGVIDFASDAAEVIWSDELGDVIERRTPDGLYVQLDPPSGGWFQFTEDNATPTSYALNPFTDLSAITDFVNEGTEQVNGLTATRFVGTSNPQDCIKGAGFSLEDEQEFGDGVICGVSVWIDDDGLIIRIDRIFGATNTAGVEARSVRSTTFTDFGSAVRITTPELVEEAPEGQ